METPSDHAITIYPSHRVCHFNEAEPGSLLVMPWYGPEEEARGIALRARFEDVQLWVPLGPTYPHDLSYPCVLGAARGHVWNLGTEFHVELSANPCDIAFSLPGEVQSPSEAKTLAVLMDNTLFLRVDSKHRDRSYSACFVNVADGIVEYRKQSFRPVAISRWRILVPSPGKLVEVIRYEDGVLQTGPDLKPWS